jgi:hypothetical protein
MRALLGTILLITPLGPAQASPILHSPVAVKAPSTKLPKDAQKILDGLEARRLKYLRQAERRLEPYRNAALRKLKQLQDRYCKQAKLDEAVAIRNRIRQVLGVQKDPGRIRAQPGDVGRSTLYEVVGAGNGTVWGTDIYTTDSHLGTAAVHAGILKPGQRGIVRVRILPGQSNYVGSTRHGVTTSGYGRWGLSFTVEPKGQRP